jgi:hypothetical protein
MKSENNLDVSRWISSFRLTHWYNISIWTVTFQCKHVNKTHRKQSFIIAKSMMITFLLGSYVHVKFQMPIIVRTSRGSVAGMITLGRDWRNDSGLCTFMMNFVVRKTQAGIMCM